jgi:[ribosomal protein S18]-alanine N-acetyltransferase
MSAVLQPRTWFEPMTEASLEAVLSIECRIYTYPWTFGNFRDSLRAGYSCVVYRSNGEIAGYAVAMIAAGEAHLLNLSIAHAYQGHGHGHRLLEYMMSLAKARKARMLFLEVRPSNLAARHLYERHGFTRIGVRRDYYPAEKGRENALVLAVDL